MIIITNQYSLKALLKIITNTIKAEVIKIKKLLIKQYLYMIMPYLSDLINDHRTIRNESNEWKIQLNISINFRSSNDTGEIRTFFVWSDDGKIRSGNETDDIIKRLFESFLTDYQNEEKIL